MEKLKQVKAIWEWSKEAQQAFDTLKECFSNPSILLVPDKTKPFILETNTSLEVWGVVLRQYNHNRELKACVKENTKSCNLIFKFRNHRSLSKTQHCLS